MTKYNKLVRDKIPEYIRSQGVEPVFHVAGEGEFPRLLGEKLLEEARELIGASPEEALGEIADVQEVLDAICELHGFSKTQVEKEKVRKAMERGQFKKHIVLDES